MSSIDSRIVTMKFDNTSFQKGAAATMDVLKKLSTAITGMPTQAMSGLGSVGSHFNMNTVSNEVAHVGAGFTAMATVAVTALATITHKAVETGLNLVKSLTIAPITSGLHEYETQLGSIQTILANTGLKGKKGLNEVNSALNTLNEYSDDTIYNFSEMARNIGTFTAAGIKLDTATGAIKGIANLAALSGSNSQQASTAMYQLSQALSTGSLKLQDWNSVVNAGMGGKVFQEALKDTARVHHVAVDEMIKDAGSFRSSLKEGWISSDILTETLSKFTGDLTDAQLKQMGYNKKQIKEIQDMGVVAFNAATKVKTMSQLIGTLQEAAGSGWAKTWQLIFGDFNQAKKLWTGASVALGGIIGRSADRRNKLFKSWNNLGGRDVLIDTITQAFKALLHIVNPVIRAFKTVFPPTTGKQLLTLTEGLRTLAENMTLSVENMHKLRRTFRGVFAVISIGWEILKGLIHYFASFIGLLSGGSGGILDFTSTIAGLLIRLQQWLVKGGLIKKFFDTVIAGRAKLLKPIIAAISSIVSWFSKLLGLGANAAIDLLIEGFHALEPMIEKVSKWLESMSAIVQGKVLKSLKNLEPMVKNVKEWLEEAASVVQKKVVGGFKTLQPILKAVAHWFGDVGKAIKNSFFDVLDKIKPILKDIGGAIADAFTSMTMPDMPDMPDMSGALGGLGDIGGNFDIGNKTDSAVKGLDNVRGALAKLAPTADGTKEKMSGFAGALEDIGGFLADIGRGIGSAISTVWDGTMNLLSGIFTNAGGFFSGLSSFFGRVKDGIIGFFGDMGFDEGLSLVNTGFFIAFYAMLRNFVKSLKGVADSVSGVLNQVSSNLKTMQQDVKANIIMKIAIALGVLAVSIFILSTIDKKQLANALAALVVMIGELVGALIALQHTAGDSMKDALRMDLLAAALVGIASAILILSGAIAILGNMKLSTIQQGIAAVTMILGVIVIAAAAFSKSGGGATLMAVAIALGILSVSLVALAGALELYAALDTKTLLDGGWKAAATLAAIGLAMLIFPPNMLLTATALVIVAGALIVLAHSLKIIAKIPMEDLGKALLTVFSLLTLLALAMIVMEAGLPGALAMLVMAFALNELAKTLEILAALDWSTVFKGLGIILLIALALGIAALLAPAILILGASLVVLGAGLLLAGAGLFLFASALALLAISGAAGGAVLIGVVMAFLTALPLMVQQFGLFILAVATVVREKGPKLVHAFGTLINSMIDEITAHIPHLQKLFAALIHAGLQTIRETTPDIVATGWFVLKELLKGIRDNIGEVVVIVSDIIVNFLDALGEQLPRIIDAGAHLLLRFLDGLADAIEKYDGRIRKAAWRIIKAIFDGMLKAIEAGAHKIYDAFMDIANKAWEAIKDKFHIFSPSKDFEWLGKMMNEGLGIGLKKHSNIGADEATAMGNKVLDRMKKTMDGVKAAVATDIDMSPKVAPVLDLTDFHKKAGEMHGVLGAKPIKADLSYNHAAGISADQTAKAISALEAANIKTQPIAPITLVQNNNSPKSLSAVDIYRQTRSQLALAQDALKHRVPNPQHQYSNDPIRTIQQSTSPGGGDVG